MKTFTECIEKVMKEAFQACGYEEKFGKVTLSNRPDLCEYQCNGAMAAAKTYRKAPIMIANDVVEKLQDKSIFESAQAVNPGTKTCLWKKQKIQKPSSSTTADQMWPSLSMWGISVLQSSEKASRGWEGSWDIR